MPLGQDSYKKKEKSKGGSLKAAPLATAMKMAHLLASNILRIRITISLIDKIITEGHLRSAQTVLPIPITGPEIADLESVKIMAIIDHQLKDTEQT